VLVRGALRVVPVKSLVEELEPLQVPDVENQRGRPFVLTAATVAPVCNGMWIATETTDYVICEQDTTPDNQLRIIGHEIGHIVLDHQGIPLASSDMGRLFFPNLDPAMVAASLARSVSSAVYSPTEEVEAETFASLLQERIRSQGRTDRP
jgi:hypothetical protein